MSDLSPSPKFRATYAGSGFPMVGGRLYTYKAGTTPNPSNYQTTYKDSINTANTNPVILNSAGECDLWLSDLPYKYVLEDVFGNTVWTVDNITTASGSVSAAISKLFVATYADISTTPLAVGQVFTLVCHTSGAYGGGQFIGVAGTVVDDGGTQKNTATGGVYAQRLFFGQTLNANMFGAIPNTSFISTAAFNLAKEYCKTRGGGTVNCDMGIFKITDTINVDDSRIYFRGQGAGATVIDFEPTSNNKTCFNFERISGGVGSVLYQGGIEGFSFYSLNTTLTKTAISLIDCSGLRVVNCYTQFPHWAGGGNTSVFLDVAGREMIWVRDIHAAADKPMIVRPIPASHPAIGIGIDQSKFENLYLNALSANPCIELMTGLLLTQTRFGPTLSLTGGTDGFRWIDTTSAATSNGLTIVGMRPEQGVSSTSYMINIQHNSGLQNLAIKDANGGSDRRGYFLRKTESVSLENTYYNGTGIAVDVDATVKRFEGQNCFWQALSTANIAGQRLVSSSPKNPSNGALPPNFIYNELSSGTRNAVSDATQSGSMFTMANGDVISIGTTVTYEFLMIARNGGVSPAMFSLNGQGNATTKHLPTAAGFWSSTVGTASCTNIYWNAGTSAYEMQNNTGGSVNYTIYRIGSSVIP